MNREPPQTIPLSLVIPVLNEEGNLRPLWSAIGEALNPLGLTYEVVIVDDGSTDGTLNVARQIQAQDPRWVIVALRRNFGQTAAMSAGFDHARGEVIVTMDGDLQNDPADIPTLLELAKEYDLVSGWRVNRKDPFFTRHLPSRIANWVISVVTGVKLHDYGCTLKAYRREVVRSLHLYGEMHRFIPAVASWMGVSVTEVKVRHHPRRIGRSKYGLGRILRVLLDLLTVKFLLSYSTKPIQIFGLLGLLSGMAGGLLGVYLSLLKLLGGQEIGNRPLLLLSVLLVILGVQLIILGLLGELLVRIYHESQGKPVYAIRQVFHTPLEGPGVSANEGS
ncbi:MAG: glycosyltransferase family 2 protein [Candidatus Methylomirabilales bacterium]